MTRSWVLSKRQALVRDLVRDYCTVHHTLAEQRRRFANDGTVSFVALRNLLGEDRHKGVFWRLKDTAHHLFGQEDTASSACLEGYVGHAAQDVSGDSCQVRSLLLDWCIGYAFHECAKLKEDAFQARRYVHRLEQIAHRKGGGVICASLRGLGGDIAESSGRELNRILAVLDLGLGHLVSCLDTEGHNTRLARWLACEEDLAREVLGQGYDILLNVLFGGNKEQLYILAAKDFLEAGRREPALRLLDGAQKKGALGVDGLVLLHKLTATAAQSCGLCATCPGKRCAPTAMEPASAWASFSPKVDA
ncbi:MAG: hypothetical protein IJU37_12795 [Desulfovibrio sp.]|nr:hypothetical protein [Desulfovibrio sp.]